MTEREALKLALEALELEDMACRYEKDPTPEHIAKAITAIKEALAQPVIDKSAAIRIATSLGWEPKRAWVGLTQEDIDIAFDETQEGGGFWEFADAIEAKLKEKNT